jgi:hypothetical protein
MDAVPRAFRVSAPDIPDTARERLAAGLPNADT